MVPFLVQIWRRFVYFTIGHLILILCGFYSIKNTPVSLAKGSRASIDATIPNRKKHLIVSNHCSYIDIIYFATWYAPVFLYVSGTGQVKPVSMWTAILQCGNEPESDAAAKPLSLYLEQGASSRTIVIFPEVTNTY